MSWSDFEEACATYLNENYECGNSFKCVGGSNSTVSDISFRRGNFYIECKMGQAQCGQFVVKDKNGKFVYSEMNRNPNNLLSRFMVETMNNEHDAYSNAGTSGAKLKIDPHYIYSWINEAMRNKNVKFIITATTVNDKTKFLVFKREDLKYFFNVQAIYRQKTSGSNSISTIHEKAFLETFKNYIKPSNKHVEIKDKNLFIDSDTNYNELVLEANGRRFMLKRNLELGRGAYRVRQLSNTHNSNIIFSISLKPLNSSMESKLVQADIELKKLTS
ncbi:hypothetical protein [Taylorella asinigenitalis]|uniref:hypothetical protein n=1 Tax=Taylorella asinigenitalis TaxID=84590 RepID=UPI00048A82D7|nr:hypothetical protein [Taylorella asinigenitalis]